MGSARLASLLPALLLLSSAPARAQDKASGADAPIARYFDELARVGLIDVSTGSEALPIERPSRSSTSL